MTSQVATQKVKKNKKELQGAILREKRQHIDSEIGFSNLGVILLRKGVAEKLFCISDDFVCMTQS